MIELALSIALLIVARRLRRATANLRQPQSIRIDVFHHFPGANR
jgi:hypothetical protein